MLRRLLRSPIFRLLLRRLTALFNRCEVFMLRLLFRKLIREKWRLAQLRRWRRIPMMPCIQLVLLNKHEVDTLVGLKNLRIQIPEVMRIQNAA